MRYLTFMINGKDLSSLCNQYGYSAGNTPIYSDEVVTMDKKRHSAVIRWQGWCSVTLNDISDAEAAEFAAALQSAELSVSYYNPALGRQVTQEMTVDGLEYPYLLRDQTGRYWSGKTLNFTQR